MWKLFGIGIANAAITGAATGATQVLTTPTPDQKINWKGVGAAAGIMALLHALTYTLQNQQQVQTAEKPFEANAPR